MNDELRPIFSNEMTIDRIIVFFFYLKNLNNSLERKIVSKEDADFCKTKIEP